MFTTIYKYELKYWLKQPAIYLYAIIIFGMAFITMSGMASEPPNRFNDKIMNSGVMLFDMTRRFMFITIILLPAVIGLSIFRDFNSRMFMILFTYPFEKIKYIFAKFLSAFTVFAGISSLLCLAYFIGTQMPFVTAELLGPFDVKPYLYIYGVLLLPTLFFCATIIFTVVLFTRNIYAGFISIFLIIIFRQITGVLFTGEELFTLQAIMDPFGLKPISHYIKDWTVEEKNLNQLPLHGLVLYNRVFWLFISFAILFISSKVFKFHQNPISLTQKKLQHIEAKKLKLGSLTKVTLPKVNFTYSFWDQLKTCWFLSISDFKFIMSSRSFQTFVLAGLLFVLFIMSTVKPRWDTETLPMTWQILELPSVFYSGVINAITFLYTGFLVQRGRMSKMNQLLDINPVSNWVLLLSKFLATVKMQMVLLFLVMLGGIISQSYKGYFNYEIGQYLFNLYGINLIHFAIWAMLAIFIHSIFDNPYVSFFILCLIPVGFIAIGEFGPKFLGMHFLEQMQFRFNQAPGDVFGVRYSDMDGYGPILKSYFTYKLYWAIFGCLLLMGASLFWKRGLTQSFKERLGIAKKRFTGKLALGFVVVLVSFISMGFVFYYDTNIKNDYLTRGQNRDGLNAAIKKYKSYEYINQPKITSVNVEMNLFPEERTFTAKGSYTLKNLSNKNIDTLIINYVAGLHTSYEFNTPHHILSTEKIASYAHFDIVALDQSMNPGDSLKMSFKNFNDPNTLLRTNAWVKEHGTFIEDDIFPRLGNWLLFFKEDNNMGDDYNKPHPSDESKHIHSFMARDADLVNFESTVSTSEDQIAIAPGELQREWTKDGRRYFHYKMNRKIAMSYLFMSGRYAIATDQWNDIELEILYHQDHPFNVQRMMDGLKAGIAYCSENFSPYQFKQLKMIEFSQTDGATAHGFPASIPAGEGSGFIADVDDSDEGGTDYAFGTAVHEAAHMWWGHQVLPADALGSKMVVESLAEYVNVMVKKKHKGIQKARNYLNHSRKSYLELRNNDRRQESPLMYTNPDQNYIHYPKGAMVFYAMADYIGEEKLNAAIKKYVDKVAFQEGTYTTSIEMVDTIRTVVPDSLQYLITDLFETVSLYDNKILDWKSESMGNDEYKVSIDCQVSKYRSGRNGKRIYSDQGIDSLHHLFDQKEMTYSLPLADYLEIGIFDKEGNEIYLNKHKFNAIYETIEIIIDLEPSQVGIDPYHLMIDKNVEDNRM